MELLYAAGMMGCAALIGTFGKIRKKFFVIHLGFLLMAGAMLTCGLLPPTMVGLLDFRRAVRPAGRQL